MTSYRYFWEGYNQRNPKSMGHTFHYCSKKGRHLEDIIGNRAINKITVKYKHPILGIDYMLDKLCDLIVFSSIYLKVVTTICMKLGGEWKTVFKTKFGLYELILIPFF